MLTTQKPFLEPKASCRSVQNQLLLKLDAVFGGVIVLNAVVIGIETEFRTNKDDFDARWYAIEVRNPERNEKHYGKLVAFRLIFEFRSCSLVTRVPSCYAK